MEMPSFKRLAVDAGHGVGLPGEKPPGCSDYAGGDLLERANPERSGAADPRDPAPAQEEVPVALADAGRIQWLREPAIGSSSACPGSFRTGVKRWPPGGEAAWRLPAGKPQEGQFVTFEFKEQIVGWPQFTIEAPEGTVVELMCQERHDPSGPEWLDSQYFNWSRFICRKGLNRFEPFDFESLCWLQLHVATPHARS